MTYKFKVDNDYLSQIKYYSGVSGNKNVYMCEFDINCEESGAVWFAVFKKDDEVYIVHIENQKCSIPYEVLENAGVVYLGCYAECTGDKRISTNWIPLTVEKGAYSEGTAPQPPSEELWETLLKNSVPVIGENGNWFTYDMAEEVYVDTGFCAKGDTGEQGIQGAKGDKGDTGDRGPQGIQGEKGPKGDKGDIGDAGPQGIQGPKGDKGDTGAQGPKGDKGDTGETGPQGIQGPKGDKGDTGAQGPQGIQGEKGAQGEKGETGPQGIQGQKGDKGDTGAAGYTPQKGVDYFTQVDIAEIAGNVDIADKLTEPSSGIAVGKYFRVASIDNDGHAVLEYADAQPAWRKICDYTLEEDVVNITINKDSNNEPFVLSRAVLQVISPVAEGTITGYIRFNGDAMNYGALVFGRTDYKTIARAEVITDDDFMTYAIISESSYPHGVSNIKSNLQICYGEQAVNHKKITQLYMFAGALHAGTRVIVWGIDK